MDPRRGFDESCDPALLLQNRSHSTHGAWRVARGQIVTWALLIIIIVRKGPASLFISQLHFRLIGGFSILTPAVSFRVPNAVPLSWLHVGAVGSHAYYSN